MTMTLRKLEKSLLLKVEQRLAELIPDAEVRSTRRSLRIRWSPSGGLAGLPPRSASGAVALSTRNVLDCEISVRALAEACIGEDRAAWGPIAGTFCNLVAARVNAFFAEPLSRKHDLDRIFPILVADDPIEDALQLAAAPTPALAVASTPWLEGFRIEFEFRGPGTHRRLFLRDVEPLGDSAESVATSAFANLDVIAGDLPLDPVDDERGDGVLLCCKSEDFAPLLLATEAGQRAILEALALHGASAGRALVCIPRTDRLYVCSMKTKAAMSRLVATSWADFEADDTEAAPLSARLFTVSEQLVVRFLDPGQPALKFPEWRVTSVGPVQFAVPDSWQVSQQGDRWVVWTSNDGPRVRIRDVEGRSGAPLAGFEMAERMRQKQRVARAERGEPDVELGHGFFNGLPWTSVDTGTHDGVATASLFVVLPTEIVVLQTEIPVGSPPNEQMTLQKIISTIHPVPPAPPLEGDDV
jgi:hypothetical protein